MNDSGYRRRPGDGNWQRRRIRAFVQEFTLREGYSPSYRQIGDELGLAVSTVSYHVALLKADGSLHREDGQPMHRKSRNSSSARPKSRQRSSTGMPTASSWSPQRSIPLPGRSLSCPDRSARTESAGTRWPDMACATSVL